MRRRILGVLMVCTFMIPGSMSRKSLGADIWRFDFGSEKSPVWDGATPITPADHYSAEKGFGWLKPFPKEDAGGTHYAHKGKGKTYTDPDDLTCDYVRHEGPFRVDVPPGKYRVSVILGDIGAYRYEPNKSYGVDAQGKHAFVQKIDHTNFYSEYFFRNQDWEYTPNADVFEDLLRPHMPQHSFEVDAPDGYITLSAHALPLMATIIYPAAQGEAFREEIASTNKDRRTQFYEKQFSVRWSEPDSPEPEPAENDVNRGYILFKKNFMDEVLPNTRPAPQEMHPEAIEMFATPGEYESRGLSVYPLEDIASANLTLQGDLLSPDGRMANSAVQISRVTYGIVGSRRKGLKNCTVRPWILRPAKPAPLHPKWCSRYWITVKVPAGSKGGLYEGTLVLEATGKPETKIPLRIQVLPFTLHDRPKVLRGFFYFGPRYYRRLGYYDKMEPQYWAQVERELRFMKEYGFNSLDVRKLVRVEVVDNEVKCDFSQLDRFWAIYKKVGLSGYAICSDGAVGTAALKGQRPFRLPMMLPYETERDRRLLKQTITAFRDHALEAQWPGAPEPLLFWCTDELTGRSPFNVDQGMELLKIYREIEGIRTYSTINGADELRLIPYLDMVSLNVGLSITPEVVKRVGNADCKLGFFNIGGSRFAYGLYMWRTGGVINLQWHWFSGKQDPYCMIDGANPEYAFAYPTESGVLPTYNLELLREGVDDFKYLVTLEDLLASANVENDPNTLGPRTRVKKAVQLLKDSIGSDIAEVHFRVGQWDSSAYQKARALAAGAILALIGTNGNEKLSLLSASSPVTGQKKKDLQQVPWWNDGFAFRTPVELNAGAQRRNYPLVTVILDLSEVAGEESVDPNSVRVVELSGNTSKEIPSIRQWMNGQRCRVTWKLNETLAPFAWRGFHVYWDLAKNGPKRAPAYEPLTWSLSEAYPKDLVRNGGFEEVGKDGDLPEYWQLRGRPSHGAKISVTEDEVHLGRKALKLTVPAPRAKAVLVQDLGRIKPNTQYILSYWARIPETENGKPWTFAEVTIDRGGGQKWVMGRYLIGQFDWMRGIRAGVRQGSGIFFETPDDVTTGRILLRASSGPVTAYIDNVKFEEVRPGDYTPMPLYVKPTQER